MCTSVCDEYARVMCVLNLCTICVHVLSVSRVCAGHVLCAHVLGVYTCAKSVHVCVYSVLGMCVYLC